MKIREPMESLAIILMMIIASSCSSTPTELKTAPATITTVAVSTAPPSISPTTEATSVLIPTPRPTGNATPFPISTPSANVKKDENLVVASDEKLVAMYENGSDLKECQENRKVFCARLLNAYDLKSGFIADSFTNGENTICHYIKREDIINYGKTGKGLDVLCIDKNGKVAKEGDPVVALINTTPETDRCIIESIQFYQNNGAPDFMEWLKKCGVNSLFTFQLDKNRGTGMCAYNPEGTILFNFNSADLKREGKKPIVFGIERALGMEPIGVCYEIVKKGNADLDYSEVIKQFLGGEMEWALYKKSGNKLLSIISDDMIQGGYNYCDWFLIRVDDPKLKKEVDWLKQNNLIPLPKSLVDWQNVDKINGKKTVLWSSRIFLL